MKLYNVDVEAFAKLIESCEGNVVLVTEDGDRLVTNSMLSALIGFKAFLSVAEAKEIEIECDNPNDQAKVLNFMLHYRRDENI